MLIKGSSNRLKCQFAQVVSLYCREYYIDLLTIQNDIGILSVRRNSGTFWKTYFQYRMSRELLPYDVWEKILSLDDSLMTSCLWTSYLIFYWVFLSHRVDTILMHNVFDCGWPNIKYYPVTLVFFLPGIFFRNFPDSEYLFKGLSFYAKEQPWDEKIGRQRPIWVAFNPLSHRIQKRISSFPPLCGFLPQFLNWP